MMFPHLKALDSRLFYGSAQVSQASQAECSHDYAGDEKYNQLGGKFLEWAGVMVGMRDLSIYNYGNVRSKL
ncbi:hypothetical protein CDAR_221691 [Caerostris darwini]|uniref:Uncharacterized protein n=1 Tax=Caerostris darwini TaxID=1538125 RepID=A0AAV4WML7_9ARAC|nr:hypothetical protein CDAR_221691 [Caerostris darwini]